MSNSPSRRSPVRTIYRSPRRSPVRTVYRSPRRSPVRTVYRPPRRSPVRTVYRSPRRSPNKHFLGISQLEIERRQQEAATFNKVYEYRLPPR